MFIISFTGIYLSLTNCHYCTRRVKRGREEVSFKLLYDQVPDLEVAIHSLLIAISGDRCG